MPSEVQQRGGVGDRADDVDAAFDLVEPFQRVRGPDLPPVCLADVFGSALGLIRILPRALPRSFA